MPPLSRSFFRDRKPRKRNRHSELHGRWRRVFENLEERTVLAATLINTPTWIERGPAPIINSQNVELNGNGAADSADVVAGAVAAIAVDPTNAGHVFVGTTNGGVWETGNVNSGSPIWSTTTDQMPSLAISAIAINPANTSHIYAGTGNLSSAEDGGSAVGLYRSFDGGTTWTQLGFDTFHGLEIRSIIPTSLRTIFVAASNLGSNSGGVYRSDDFGVSWVRLSGMAGTFLPNASVTDLVSFPVNSTTTGFYAAVPFNGIFRSTNGGASWQSVTNNLSSSAATALRIDLSVSPASGNAVYAALIEIDGTLINVFRSDRGTDGVDNNRNRLIDEPAEATWQAIATTPPVIDDPSLGPDNLHFAILADSTRNDIVYISGSATGLTGNLFRGNATTHAWTSLTGQGANNTAPHPDARDLVFSGGNILRADDGGIYRLVDPLGIASNFPTIPDTIWRSAIGNLSNTEVYSVALDNQNNTLPADDIILAGLQDNGINQRSAAGQWTQIFGSDGFIVQAFDAETPTDDYAATQFLTGSRIGGSAFPPRVNGAPPNTFLTSQFDATMGSIFKVVYQVHASEPTRVLTGTQERLYESFDRQNNVTSIGGVDNSGQLPTPKPVPGLTGVVLSMAYGSIANPEIAYVGTDTGDIFVRSTAGGTFVKTNFSVVIAANEGSGSTHTPLDIVLDTNNPQRLRGHQFRRVYDSKHARLAAHYR